MTNVDRSAPRHRLKLRDGVRIEFGASVDDAVTVRSRDGAFPLGALTSALRDALGSLAEGADEDEAARGVAETEGLQALARWSWLTQMLLDTGCLRCALASAAGESLATIFVLAPGPSIRFSPLCSPDAVALSRFAWLHAADGVTVLESPLGRARVELDDPRLAGAAAALARPQTADQLADAFGLCVETVAGFLGFLHGARALAAPGEADGSCGLALWEVQDALFHVHSRLGRRDRAYGATYRFQGRIPPPPAVAPLEGPVVPLARPDLDKLRAKDLPFAKVLDARRSLRKFSPASVDVATLSEFLYRSARDTGLSTQPIQEEAEREFDRITRPYPGAGGCHPLDVYVVARMCTGLERGLYRYEPTGHALVALAADPCRLDRLLAEARSAAGIEENPPVLVVLAARFARTLWKYEGIGYANLLKDVGALLQTMYLVATAMGLAPCALGGGDAVCFAEAAGLAFWEETSVGEFMLGHPAGGAL
jgi:SagB-type dehydrogenase family enzyme